MHQIGALSARDARTLYRRDLLDVAYAHWHEHPVIVADVARPADGAHRLSDYVSHGWRRRRLFGDFYRPLADHRQPP